jgi:methionine--tRNA ligase beta chain
MGAIKVNKKFYSMTISFEEFKKIDIKIGKIVSAQKVEDSEKLLKLEVDFGSTSQVLSDGKISEVKEKRQIIAGIGKFYEPENLIGKLCPFVFNLDTKMINGVESQGMILAADDGRSVLLHPDNEVTPGSIVK